jgi:hypothetical protein
MESLYIGRRFDYLYLTTTLYIFFFILLFIALIDTERTSWAFTGPFQTKWAFPSPVPNKSSSYGHYPRK